MTLNKITEECATAEDHKDMIDILTKATLSDNSKPIVIYYHYGFKQRLPRKLKKKFKKGIYGQIREQSNR